MTQNNVHQRRFSVRTLLILVALVAGLLAAYQYRERANKPDLTVTAADVAWATDHHIWKIDLSEQRNVYGVQVVVFGRNGTRRLLGTIGGATLIDTVKNPILIVSASGREGSVNGKLKFGGMGISFSDENLLAGKFISWSGTPVLNEDYYYLLSDSKTIGVGKQPFEKSSNKLAIEILRSPR